MSHIFQLLFLLSLIALSWNLTTKLDNFEQFCTWKQLEKGMSLSGNYIISGFNELDVIAMVFTEIKKSSQLF